MSINQQWDESPTRLFLNGPTLSFSTQPSDITLDSGGSGTFVGIATAEFPATVTDAETDGEIVYQWYRKLDSETSFSALGAGSTFYSGQTSTTLSINFALSPDFHNSQYYLQASYNPVALGVTEKSSADALNEPIISSTATLKTNPGLSIVGQPSDQTAVINSNATFTVTPSLTDTTQGALRYQWSLNGSPVSDGTTRTTTTLTSSSTKYQNSSTTEGRIIIEVPDNATEVQIEISGGKGGTGGNYSNGLGGGGGYGARGTFKLPDGGRQLELYIGTAGATGTGGGSATNYNLLKGGTGGTGNSSGGGGGSGSFVRDVSADEYIIIAAGGGGGGGGAQNSGTSNTGSNAGDFSSFTDFADPTSPFGANGTSTGSGGGGGGGGSGFIGGSGGSSGANVPPPPPPPPPPPVVIAPQPVQPPRPPVGVVQPPRDTGVGGGIGVPQPVTIPAPNPPPKVNPPKPDRRRRRRRNDPPPAPPPRRNRRRRRRRGKIICQSLARLGYFKDQEMNDADQRFAIWLKKNDPVAYDGYIVWARTVVDLMNGEGNHESFRKIAFFWEKDDAKRIYLQQKLVCYYMDALARPWAEEMAHLMGAKGYEKSNPAGKLVMMIGIPLSRLVGRAKSNKTMNSTLKVFLIWKIVTILLISCGSISAIDLLLNKIKGLFKW